jgi:hypothetical protein
MTKIGLSVSIRPETLMILRDLMRMERKNKSNLIEEAILKKWEEAVIK